MMSPKSVIIAIYENNWRDKPAVDCECVTGWRFLRKVVDSCVYRRYSYRGDRRTVPND